ncbi:MAG: response regulator transcription factor [Mucinivorans sp.]
MGQTILIVDDEIDLLEILAFNLQKAGYEILTASSGAEALTVIEAHPQSNIALMLLDVMMSGMDGFELARKIRKKGILTPIVFLTAKDSENDILTGFEVGADDYIAKPFSIRQVVARVKAVTARVGQPGTLLTFDNITIEPAGKIVTIDGQPLTLTKTEYSILALLVANPGRLLTREDMIARVWGADVYVEPRTVDVHIARLRKKMGPWGSLLVNRSGYGYTLGS